MKERLQKVIARAGICSRRKAEELIQAGRVFVNGSPITVLGSKVDATRDHIKVDGKRLRPDTDKVYLVLNKPKGYVCTLSDPEGRPTIAALVKGVSKRVFPVGRLDYASEGLLLLTNDGDFANRIASAGDHCPKTYLAKVRGAPDSNQLEKLRQGITLDGKPLAPCRIEVLKETENPWFKVTLIEGRNHQIRRMFERMAHPVLKLKRVQIGFLRATHLKSGEYRTLTADEIKRFKSLRPDIPNISETSHVRPRGTRERVNREQK